MYPKKESGELETMPNKKQGKPLNKRQPKKAAETEELSAEELEARRVELAKAVSIIESKPHMVYIRYLLTKRTNIRYINNELYRIGFSAAREGVLANYYFAVIKPFIKDFRLTRLYAKYEKDIINMQQRNFSRSPVGEDLLSYRTEVAPNEAMATDFCMFCRALGIDKAWSKEILSSYGTHIELIPTDENGKRIIAASVNTSIENVINSDHRNLIEQMILQGVPDARITTYIRTNFGEELIPNDISIYRNIFFNVQTDSVEKNMAILQREKENLASVLQDAQRTVGRFVQLSVGERQMYVSQLKRRISEIEDTLKTLQMAQTNMNFQRGVSNSNEIANMFLDIMNRGYSRFKDLDEMHDRDIPGLQAQTMKIISASYEKFLEAKERGQEKQGDITKQVGEMYKERLEEIGASDKERANASIRESGYEGFDDDINLDDIGGIEELGANYNSQEDESGEE